MSDAPAASAPAIQTFRLSRAAYLGVLLLALGVTTLVQRPIFAVAYVLPVVAAVFVWRTATIVDPDRGITVRALAGQQQVPWGDVLGLSLTGRNLYVVTDDGALRMPCVRIADLAAVSEASGGRLPSLPRATPKYAPTARRRR